MSTLTCVSLIPTHTHACIVHLQHDMYISLCTCMCVYVCVCVCVHVFAYMCTIRMPKHRSMACAHLTSPLSPRTVAVSVPGGRFGAGSGRIYLTGLLCTGNESALLDCPRAVSGVQGCGHSQDAGVACTGRLSRDMSSGWDYVPVSLLWVAD